MEKTKIDQVRDKICDYMLGMDLSKLHLYELITYINAYKTLEGAYPFPGWDPGCTTGLGFTPYTSPASDTLEGEQS